MGIKSVAIYSDADAQSVITETHKVLYTIGWKCQVATLLCGMHAGSPCMVSYYPLTINNWGTFIWVSMAYAYVTHIKGQVKVYMYRHLIRHGAVGNLPCLHTILR